MEISNRLRLVYHALLAIFVIYIFIDWDKTTTTSKMAIALICILIIFEEVAYRKLSGNLKEDFQKRKWVCYISNAMIIAIMLLSLNDIVSIWGNIDTVSKIGFIMVYFSVTGVVVLTTLKYIKNDPNIQG